jgi:hypothetical protein
VALPVTAAEMCAVEIAMTAGAVTVNVVELLPCGTVTEAPGTVATDVLSLATLTTTPPAGAARSSVTVAVDVDAVPDRLLVMLVGFNVIEETTGGLTVKDVFADPRMALPEPVAVMVAVVATPTALVVAVNCAVVAPASTITLAGTAAAALLLERVTVRCGSEAEAATGPLSVTVPVEFAAPPSTLVGFMVTEITDGGTTVRVADCAGVTSTFAEIDTGVDTATASGVTVNVVDKEFSGTVTLARTVAAPGVPLVSVTTVPPVGAARLRVTVPVEFWPDTPPTIEVGFRETLTTVVASGGVTVSVAL